MEFKYLLSNGAIEKAVGLSDSERDTLKDYEYLGNLSFYDSFIMNVLPSYFNKDHSTAYDELFKLLDGTNSMCKSILSDSASSTVDLIYYGAINHQAYNIASILKENINEETIQSTNAIIDTLNKVVTTVFICISKMLKHFEDEREEVLTEFEFVKCIVDMLPDMFED